MTPSSAKKAPTTAAAIGAQRLWIIDPIDGTKAYVEGGDEWAVHIALMVAGELVLGVVAMPASGRCICGIPGQGLWELRDGQISRSAKWPLAAVPAGEGPRLVLSHRQFDNPHPALIGLDHMPRHWSHSVGVKAIAMLDGEAQVYVQPSPLADWDVAAPAALIRAAGGRCGLCSGGR